MTATVDVEEKTLRVVLTGRWTVAELAEFLRRLDELYSFAFVLHEGVRIGKTADQLKTWLSKSPLYSQPTLPDLPSQVKQEAEALHSYFSPGKELRVLQLRFGSPNFFDLIGLSKLVESIGAGFKYLITHAWRRDRALNDLEVREKLIKVIEDDVTLMKKNGYPPAAINEVVEQYYGLHKKIRPFVDGGKVIEITVSGERRALPEYGTDDETKKKARGTKASHGRRAKGRKPRGK